MTLRPPPIRARMVPTMDETRREDRPNSEKRPRRRPDAFVMLVIAACVTAFVPGAYTLLRLDGFYSTDVRLAAAIVEILFSFLCVALVLQIRSKGDGYPGVGVFVAALAGLSLFLAYEGGAGLVWVLLFPPIAAFALGPRKGVAVSATFEAVVIAVLIGARDRASVLPAEFMISIAVVYSILTAFSTYFGYRLQKANDARRQEPAEREAADPRGSLADDLGVAAGVARSEAAELVVLYRRDALETVAAVPDPEAVFSYILLEGMAERAGKPGEPAPPRIAGDYEFRTLGLDDLLTKVESVIEAREAKKLIEFNKVHAQIDAALSREDETGEDSAAFERTCFAFNLSEREAAVARCILKGLTNKEISTELFISVDTVKTHVKNLFKKCETNNRIDFIKLFSRP